MDIVFVRINCIDHYFRRAVDHDGEVLEAFAAKRRDRGAARKFLKRVMKRYGRPQLVTNGLRLYRSALTMLGNQGI